MKSDMISRPVFSPETSHSLSFVCGGLAASDLIFALDRYVQSPLGML
jgi:hypothetical protein